MKILLTPSMRLTDEQATLLRADGFDLVFTPDEVTLPQDAQSIEAVVCNSLFADVDPRNFPNLQFVQLTSAGLDRVPLDYFTEANITVANAGATFVPPMTQWALQQILHFYRCADLFAQRQQRREWNKRADQLELEGKTATIIGYGAVGESIADALRHFGVKIVAVSRSPKDMPASDLYLPLNRLSAAVAESDIVVVCVAATPETDRIVDAQVLANLRPDSVFLNLARGAVVDQEALVERVRVGDLRGVALDVFQEEPLPSDSELWDLPNVVITPHVSFYSDRIRDRLFQLAHKNLLLHKVGHH